MVDSTHIVMETISLRSIPINTIIDVELTFSDILGTNYRNTHSFIENDFFDA